MSDNTIEIDIADLHKKFIDREVLSGIDLRVQRGEMLALVGGSGCGKTVLLNHLLGLLIPDEGIVQVADHNRVDSPLCNVADVSDERLDDIHSHWGMVFQQNALFSGTVLENISLGLREVLGMTDVEILPIAEKSLAAVGLDNDADFLNLDHHQLSGGMSKRLAVARAISMQPMVIFYDEPTTGLDPTSASHIHELIHDMHEQPAADGGKRTTIIITHDKDLLVRLQPRTVMLHDGKVYFDGSFADFEADASDIIRPYFDEMPQLHGRDG